MLIALRMKGETAEEMIGAARALSAAALAVRPARLSVRRLLRHRRRRFGPDQCLDGDGLRRGGCGLADRQARQPQRQLALRLGRRARGAGCARSTLPPRTARELLDQTGFCFLFAPAYHPGMKHAALVRRQLSVRTVMNLLGPCINPARPPVQLLGVADPQDAAADCRRRSTRWASSEALVVHGSGLDEVALHGETRALRLSDGEIEELEITPEDAASNARRSRSSPAAMPAENARAAAGPARRPRRRRRRGHRRSSTPPRLLHHGRQGRDLDARARRSRARRCCPGGAGEVLDALHRGEPWLNRGVLGEIAAAKRDELARALRRRVARRAARPRAQPTRRSLAGDARASPARASSWRSRRPRRRRARSAPTPIRRRSRAAMPASPMR